MELARLLKEILMVLLVCKCSRTISVEPKYTKFMYEEQLLEKIVRLELFVENIQNDIKKIVSESLMVVNEIRNSTKIELNKMADKMNEFKLEMDNFHNNETKWKAHAVQKIGKANNESSVAFFSKLSQHIDNPGVHQTVVFENVITNVGSAYNKYAGDFRAPVNGIYVFSTTLMAATSSYPYHFQVMLNGSAVSSIYIENGGTASQEVILQLKQNDSVVVHSLDAGRKIYGSGYSSFSGFLLQQTQ